jgi:hypothetical protein
LYWVVGLGAWVRVRAVRVRVGGRVGVRVKLGLG